jgi:hypothetical protein
MTVLMFSAGADAAVATRPEGVWGLRFGVWSWGLRLGVWGLGFQVSPAMREAATWEGRASGPKPKAAAAANLAVVMVG